MKEEKQGKEEKQEKNCTCYIKWEDLNHPKYSYIERYWNFMCYRMCPFCRKKLLKLLQEE